MANVNKPFGLAALRAQDGNNTGVVKHYYVPATNSTKLYIGDPVVKTGEANTAEFLGHAAGSLPAIAKASTSGAITGVIVGFLPNGESYVTGALPANTAAVALVDDDLTKNFTIQANSTISASIIGQNANIDVTANGDDYTGISGVALDVATADSTDSLQLKIMGVADYPHNELGNYTVLEVRINNDTEANGTAGV